MYPDAHFGQCAAILALADVGNRFSYPESAKHMKFTRRKFLTLSSSAGALSLIHPALGAETQAASAESLEKAASKPVLQTKLFKDPVIIESIELLRKGREHFLRVRCKDGTEGISVDNGRMDILHSLLNRLVIPYFIGKDVRDLEEHLFEVYRHQDNYKYQGLALWSAVALVEFALLDLLGRISGKPLGEILGGDVNIKAGTNEGCDAIGRGEAIAAHAVVLLGDD